MPFSRITIILKKQQQKKKIHLCASTMQSDIPDKQRTQKDQMRNHVSSIRYDPQRTLKAQRVRFGGL